MRIQKISHLSFKHTREEKGFTLVELLIVIVILSVTLISMANLLYAVIRGNAFSGKITMASTWAQEKIEQFKNIGYADLSTTSGTDTPDTGFSRSWTVTYNSPAPDMASVIVTVSWADLYGQTRRVTLNTIISQ